LPDVVKFSDKVVRVCGLNSANERNAPRNKTELVKWLGLGGGTLSKSYRVPTANLLASLERAVVMALGFGPEESEFVQHREEAWARWGVKWHHLWRSGEPKDLVDRLESECYFVERTPDDPRLTALLPKIRRRKNDDASEATSLAVAGASPPATISHRLGIRYLDRLASLQITGVFKERGVRRLLATCTFGAVEVPTEEATYLVSINRCRADIFLTEASFEPSFEEDIVASRSAPSGQMSIKREYSRINHPSWLVNDPQPKTPLSGEFCDIELGAVRGQIGGDDEASLVVNKAGFAVSALTGNALEERGVLSSLLRYLVTEHVGEIEMRGNYQYHLSAAPIECVGGDD
jgi:hypothetical protein